MATAPTPVVQVLLQRWERTECVECARADSRILVRDSKRVGGPIVAVRAHAWRAFIRALEDDGDAFMR